MNETQILTGTGFSLFCLGVYFLHNKMINWGILALVSYIIDLIFRIFKSDLERFFSQYPKLIVIYFLSVQIVTGLFVAFLLYSVGQLCIIEFGGSEYLIVVSFITVHGIVFKTRLFQFALWITMVGSLMQLYWGSGLAGVAVTVAILFTVSTLYYYRRFHNREIDYLRRYFSSGYSYGADSTDM